MRDAALPLVAAKDVVGIRRALLVEFPHAAMAIDMLLRDVRDNRPIRLTPTILLGTTGVGKSRMVRRVARTPRRHRCLSLLSAAASHDGMFSGSPKAWSSSQPSVPARAIMHSRITNPVVMLDEIEKAGSGTYNGRLWDALVPFA